MFIPARSEIGGPSRSFRLNYEKPWLCGFGRSRPERSTPQPEDLYREYYSRDNKVEIESDIYLHPDKRITPSRETRQAYDVYS